MEGIPGGVNTFLRYTYAGILFAWVIRDIWPDKISSFLIIHKIGGAALVTLGLVFVLILGVFAHAIYRVLLGEALLYPTTEFLYERTGGTRTLMSRLREQYGIVGRLERRQANRLIRAEVFHEKFRRRVDIRQGEIHVLYMTFVFLAFEWVFSFSYKMSAPDLFGGKWGLAIVAGLVWFTAMLTHIWQDSIEGDYVAARDGRVRELLQGAGYL